MIGVLFRFLIFCITYQSYLGTPTDSTEANSNPEHTATRDLFLLLKEGGIDVSNLPADGSFCDAGPWVSFVRCNEDETTPTALYIRDWNFSSLSSTIGTFSALEELHITGDLRSLPKELGSLKKLKELNLASNNLMTLPKEIGDCESLTHFHCRNNSLRTLEQSIGKLSHLSHLDLSWNSLTDLPQSLSNLPVLSRLQLHHNVMETIPGVLRELRHLLKKEDFLPQKVDVPCPQDPKSGSVEESLLVFLESPCDLCTSQKELPKLHHENEKPCDLDICTDFVGRKDCNTKFIGYKLLENHECEETGRNSNFDCPCTGIIINRSCEVIVGNQIAKQRVIVRDSVLKFEHESRAHISAAGIVFRNVTVELFVDAIPEPEESLITLLEAKYSLTMESISVSVFTASERVMTFEQRLFDDDKKWGIEIQKKNSPCVTFPCGEYGNCIASAGLGTSYICNCNSGWTGDRCTVKADYCESNECGTNSRCINLVGNYSCECFLGYVGTYCTRFQPKSETNWMGFFAGATVSLIAIVVVLRKFCFVGSNKGYHS